MLLSRYIKIESNFTIIHKITWNKHQTGCMLSERQERVRLRAKNESPGGKIWENEVSVGLVSPRGSKPSHTWVLPLRCLTLYLVSQPPTLPAHSSEVKDCTSPRMLCTTEQDSVHCSSQAVQ